MFKTSKLTILLGLIALALAYVAAKEVTNHSVKDNVLEPRATFVNSLVKPKTKSGGGGSGGNGGKKGGGGNNNNNTPSTGSTTQDLSVGPNGERLTSEDIRLPSDSGTSGTIITVRAFYNTRQVRALTDNEALIWRAAVYNEMHQSTRMQNAPSGLIGYTHNYRNNEIYGICAIRKVSDTEYHIRLCGYGDVKNGVHRFK